jgi:uncharacterized protein (DUF1015 family)
MPQIRPFRALRYDFAARQGDVSAVIAPPYDVLDQADKDALLARDGHNIVAIDLPHIPPKTEGPQQVYLDAQFTLDTWAAQGVLVREQQPALYLYHQTFEHAGQPVTRRQLIAAMRLHEFDEGIVLPHEQTFGGPKADRLALTKETRCNLSPIFGLYTDPENAVASAVAAIAASPPDATAMLEGVKNEVWVITDADILARIGEILAPKKAFIADGHHRYTTALNYRSHLREMHGGLPDDHPANYVMTVLVSMDDPGCVIQGYCRVLEGDDISLAALRAAWADGVALADAGDADMALFDGASREEQTVRFTQRDVLASLAADRHPSWRELDVAYLHTYLIDKLAVEKLGQAPTIRYVKSSAAARELAAETGGVALLPNATTMDQLRAVSEAGELMPQKSTFFYPKVATGLTIHPLYPED